jgi:hypothetical protein
MLRKQWVVLGYNSIIPEGGRLEKEKQRLICIMVIDVYGQ